LRNYIQKALIKDLRLQKVLHCRSLLLQEGRVVGCNLFH